MVNYGSKYRLTSTCGTYVLVIGPKNTPLRHIFANFSFDLVSKKKKNVTRLITKQNVFVNMVVQPNTCNNILMRNVLDI